MSHVADLPRERIEELRRQLGKGPVLTGRAG